MVNLGSTKENTLDFKEALSRAIKGDLIRISSWDKHTFIFIPPNERPMFKYIIDKLDKVKELYKELDSTSINFNNIGNIFFRYDYKQNIMIPDSIFIIEEIESNDWEILNY